jgi:UDP-glucose 4-epimerase
VPGPVPGITMKILITGALGHIGSQLIHSFRLGEVDEIIMIDNLATQRYASLFNLPAGVRYRFHEDNIMTCDLDSYLQGVDAVVHLAAMTEPTASFERASETEELNDKGAKIVADACARNNCALFFPSTTSVYSGRDEVLTEDCPPEKIKPQSPYAEAKIRAEAHITKLGQEKQLRYAIGRLGTIFGVSIGMRFHTAINRFCWQAVMKKPLTVWQTALHQRRPYLELNDAVRAIKYIVLNKKFDNEVNNIVTVNTSVSEIVALIGQYLPDVTVKQVESKIMNDYSYEVSSARFRGKGFEFAGGLDTGIAQTIDLLKGANAR